jgi:hypothetical protein
MFDFNFDVNSYHCIFYNLSCSILSYYFNYQTNYYYYSLLNYNILNYIYLVIISYENYYLFNRFY